MTDARVAALCLCAVVLAYACTSDEPDRKAVLTPTEATSMFTACELDPGSKECRVAELNDQIEQMRQQMIVVRAKLESAPQSCGVREWIEYDGRRM